MPRKRASAPHGSCGSSIRALALPRQTSPGCSRSLSRWTDRRRALLKARGWGWRFASAWWRGIRRTRGRGERVGQRQLLLGLSSALPSAPSLGDSDSSNRSTPSLIPSRVAANWHSARLPHGLGLEQLLLRRCGSAEMPRSPACAPGAWIQTACSHPERAGELPLLRQDACEHRVTVSQKRRQHRQARPARTASYSP